MSGRVAGVGPLPSGDRYRVRLANEWDWLIEFHYADDVTSPKTPRGLAMETVHKGTTSRDIELAAHRGRPDIGRILVFSLRGPLADGWTENRVHGEWVRDA